MQILIAQAYMQIKNFANMKHNMEKSHQFEKKKHFSLISQIHTEKCFFLKMPNKTQIIMVRRFYVQTYCK